MKIFPVTIKKGSNYTTTCWHKLPYLNIWDFLKWFVSKICIKCS
jgi:hypothetical protein